MGTTAHADLIRLRFVEKDNQNQLDHLKNVLGAWVRSHKDKIRKGLLTLQDARMLFLVVAQGRSYDAALEAELTSLELAVAKDPQCSRIALDVQALPDCEEEGYLSFCNPESVLEYEKPDAK
jgi:hypothetical protein